MLPFSLVSAFYKGWNAKEHADHQVNTASDQSFPASDAPSWTKTAATKIGE